MTAVYKSLQYLLVSIHQTCSSKSLAAHSIPHDWGGWGHHRFCIQPCAGGFRLGAWGTRASGDARASVPAPWQGLRWRGWCLLLTRSLGRERDDSFHWTGNKPFENYPAGRFFTRKIRRRKRNNPSMAHSRPKQINTHSTVSYSTTTAHGRF